MGNQKVSESDQSHFTFGVRDISSEESELAQFDEFEEEEYRFRRDPEESRHNEAGTHIVTQGDLESSRLNQDPEVQRLKELRRELDHLKVKAIANPQMKDELDKVVNDLEEKFNTLEERLNDFQIATSENRVAARTGVSRAWEEASYAFDWAKNQYLH